MIKKRKAYAKINIGLHVKGTSKNNYHLLDMIMTPISLYDELIFEDNKQIIVEMDNNICEMENNLCYKVAKYLNDIYNVSNGIKIKIVKNIPSGAGLGGGSSDASCVLKFLNKYWNLRLTKNELMGIGMKFGCDIPFFIENNISRVRGFGEKIKPLKVVENNSPIILIVPPFAMETKEVFKNFKNYRKNKIRESIKLLKKGKILPFNDLEETVNELKHNGIKNIKEKIKCDKIDNLMMTGSGSVLVGYLNSELTNKDIEDIKSQINDCKLILANLKMYTC